MIATLKEPFLSDTWHSWGHMFKSFQRSASVRDGGNWLPTYSKLAFFLCGAQFLWAYEIHDSFSFSVLAYLSLLFRSHQCRGRCCLPPLAHSIVNHLSLSVKFQLNGVLAFLMRRRTSFYRTTYWTSCSWTFPSQLNVKSIKIHISTRGNFAWVIL